MYSSQLVCTKALDQGNIISFISHKKKSNYNLSQLFSAMEKEMRKLNRENKCHLSTYPYIGVHVENRKAKYLMDNRDVIGNVIERVLWEWQV
jgi:hypothetical protein